MTKKDFETFLESKVTEAAPQNTIDWQAQKQEWLDFLKRFYAEIDGWLKEYIAAKKISMKEQEISITEDYIGEYKAASRILKIGENQVTLRPIGTLLLGTRGRVDMEGPKGTVKFVLTGKKSNGIRITTSLDAKKTGSKGSKPEEPEEQVWKIATPPPKVQFIELTSESFFESLMGVIDG